MLIAFAFGTLAATAMPSKEEQAKAQSIVNELMNDHVTANRKGKESNEAVGDAAMALAKDAQGEAAKFALFTGAVTYYARGKAYEKAADAIEAIMSEISDVPPQTLNGIVQKAAATAPEKKAPRLVALKKAIGRRAKAAASLKELEVKLKKSPSDPSLQRMHAELIAATGDWKKALEEFATLGGTVGKIAKGEANGNAAAAADFWWDYSPAALEAKDAIKEHASTLYRKALDYGELEGLKKNLAEKRIEEFSPVITMQKSDESQKILLVLKRLNAKKVEYLESTGTQWIDTGVRAEVITKYVTDCMMLGAGAEGSNGDPCFYIGVHPINRYYGEVGHSGRTPTSSIDNDRLRHVFRLCNTGIASEDGSWIGKTNLIPRQGVVVGDIPFYLFACSEKQKVAYFLRQRKYSAQIYQGKVLVRDFIPVRVGSTGYMFDCVSLKLFGNKGTGAFVVGPDL